MLPFLVSKVHTKLTEHKSTILTLMRSKVETEDDRDEKVMLNSFPPPGM